MGGRVVATLCIRTFRAAMTSGPGHTPFNCYMLGVAFLATTHYLWPRRTTYAHDARVATRA